MQRLSNNAVATLALRWKRLGAGWRDRRGSIAVMTAMLGVVTVGFTALAVDIGNWEGNVSTMQGAADQAVLAAGLAMSAGNSAAVMEAKGVAAANSFVNGTGNVIVAVNIPPVTGSYASNAGAVEVVITQSQQTFLSSSFLTAAFTASSRAVAIRNQAGTADQAGTCIMALAPTGTSVVGSGAISIDANTCNIYVNSTSVCDVTLSGSSTMKGFNIFLGEKSTGANQGTTQGTCVSGTSTITATGTLQLGAPPALDPYASRVIPLPSAPCMTVNTAAPTLTLNPGTYCSLTLSANQIFTLNSGLYVIDGGNVAVQANSQLKGSNVTLVLTGSGTSYGSLTVSGNSSMALTPMTSGPTAGMAVWLDKRGAKAFTAGGSTSGFNITGALYAPTSAIVLSGTASSPCSQLIAYTINISGSASFKHGCSGLGVADVGGAAGYKLTE